MESHVTEAVLWTKREQTFLNAIRSACPKIARENITPNNILRLMDTDDITDDKKQLLRDCLMNVPGYHPEMAQQNFYRLEFLNQLDLNCKRLDVALLTGRVK